MRSKCVAPHVLERVWNAFWNASGTRSGTPLERVLERVQNAFFVRLLLSSTVKRLFANTDLRVCKLQCEPQDLFSNHNHSELYTQISQAAGWITAFDASMSHAVVLGRFANDEATLEERDVEERGICVHELEDVHLECEHVLILGFRAWVFPVREQHRQLHVNETQDFDKHKVHCGR